MPQNPNSSNDAALAKFRDWNWVRTQALSNLFFFETAVCSEAWTDKFHDFGKIQKLMCDFLQDRKYLRKFLSAFRLSFKSTVLAGFMAWIFSLYLARKRPIELVYDTNIKDNTWDMRDIVKHTIMENDFLHWIVPEIPRQEKDFDVVTKNRLQHKFVRLDFTSLDSTLVSKHYPIWINDDLETDLNTKTKGQREGLKDQWRYQKAILTKIKKKGLGLEIDCGTPYHFEGLVWAIRNSTSYKKLIIPYKDKAGNLTFPELYTEEDFIQKREDMGAAIFAAQYELRPIAEEDALCRESWIRYWQVLPKYAWRTMVIDPGGVESKNDPTAITIVDTNEAGDIYVALAEEYHVSPLELLELIIRLKKDYNPDDSRIEKELYAMTVADIIKHRCPLLNLSFVEHGKRPKPERIWRLKQWWEGGRIYIHKTMTKLKAQALTYSGDGSIEHDDLLDSLAYHIDIRRIPEGEMKIHLPSGKEFKPNVEQTFNEEFDRFMKGRKAQGQEAYYDKIY